MNINHVTLSGNLTRDAELRYTKGQHPVLSFCIAVNDRTKNQQTGEWEDYPNFFDCALFGARAEKIQPLLVKGTKVSLDGKLRWRQWMQDDVKRSKVEIIVDNLDFYAARRGDGENPGTYEGVEPQMYDEDVPF